MSTMTPSQTRSLKISKNGLIFFACLFLTKDLGDKDKEQILKKIKEKGSIKKMHIF